MDNFVLFNLWHLLVLPLQELQVSKVSQYDQFCYQSALQNHSPELKALLDGPPIPIAVTVNRELMGYHVAYFDEDTQKVTCIDLHYYACKWIQDYDPTAVQVAKMPRFSSSQSCKTDMAIIAHQLGDTSTSTKRRRVNRETRSISKPSTM